MYVYMYVESLTLRSREGFVGSESSQRRESENHSHKSAGTASTDHARKNANVQCERTAQGASAGAGIGLREGGSTEEDFR